MKESEWQWSCTCSGSCIDLETCLMTGRSPDADASGDSPFILLDSLTHSPSASDSPLHHHHPNGGDSH